MNRYPLWKYILIVIALMFGLIYTLPNFYGESPAVQVSSAKSTVKVEPSLLPKVEQLLKEAGIAHNGASFDAGHDNASIRVRFADTDTQLKARDTLLQRLNSGNPNEGDYAVALNLLSDTPAWQQSVHAQPMNLGLDLRGGVHFLMQVDMTVALSKRLDGLQNSLRIKLREADVRHAGISRSDTAISIAFRESEQLERARALIGNSFPELIAQANPSGTGSNSLMLMLAMTPQEIKRAQEFALEQNRTTLEKRVNQIGVSEPIVQRQGADRIIVQLPGVQDVSEAKRILGRTATLEVRAVDETAQAGGPPEAGSTQFIERNRDGSINKVWLKRDIVVNGRNFEKADSTFDQQQNPAVAVTLDSEGGRIMRAYTRENLKKRMAIVLVEKGRGEAISVATIQGEFGNNFQITGSFSPQETRELSILISAGAIAAPMEIIEERTVGPSLGAENIKKGFHSTLWGFVAIALFMVFYYLLFGAFSVVALSFNVLLLIAILSFVQATLTLPGMAAIALALGMAIDANVLINERIREELRNGSTPAAAIAAGYDRAWATILDSNVTTLIAGLALLIVPGSVRGFAIVHCLGILTSMFSAVIVSRGLVNLWYGRQKKLDRLAIGQIWKATAQ